MCIWKKNKKKKAVTFNLNDLLEEEETFTINKKL